MLCKYIYKSVFILLGVVLVSCSKSPISVEKTTYEKVIITEANQGSTITVYVDDLNNDVSFKNIVFNRQLVPVSQEKTANGKIKLTGLIEQGSKMIENQKQETVNLPNQLQFEYNGKEDYVLLQDIDFLPTKIAPGQGK